MNIFKLFNRASSAPVARERLQILLAHERNSLSQSNLVAVLREEVLAVIARHVSVEPDKVQVKMELRDAVSTLEIEIELPTSAEVAAAAAAGAASGQARGQESGKAA